MSGASKLEGQNHHPTIHQPSILRVQDSILLHKKQARKHESESSSSKREEQPAGGGVQQQQVPSMAAAHQVLEVTLISAKDLKRVTLFTKMRVYAVASISGGDPRLPTHRTYADREGGRNPMWHAPLRFTIPPAADPRGLALHVLLRAERAFGDRDVGEVVVPMKDLAAASPEDAGSAEQRHLSYQVRRPVSGRKRGALHISYRLSDAPALGPDAHANHHHRFSLAPPASSFASKRHPGKGADSAITAYPVATPRGGGGAQAQRCPTYHQPYGPSPYAGAYPHHHQYGYGAYGYGGAPHGGAAYGYGGHSAAPAARSGGAGMGTAAGLGLGLLGGLMIGDMIADNDVDAAYDGGFMDGAAMGC